MTRNPRDRNSTRPNVPELLKGTATCLCFLGIQLVFEMGILVQVVIEGGPRRKARRNQGREGERRNLSRNVTSGGDQLQPDLTGSSRV